MYYVNFQIQQKDIYVGSFKERCQSRGWSGRVSRMFNNIRLPDLVDFERCEIINLKAVNDNALNTLRNEWSAKVNRIQARSGRGGNKLRTYRKFKSEYGVEPYVLCVRARGHTSALARLRAEVALIGLNIEIGRYTSTPINDRECPFCPGKVEDEEHVIMSCPKYSTVREGLFHATYCHPEFISLSCIDKFIFIMSSKNIANRCAKACSEILDIRSTILNS